MECDVQAVVIGAGVIGCAVAQNLAARGLAPLVLESGPRIAEGVTSRNSGVIHAGIYYPPGSLKARSCINGKNLLIDWCRRKSVPWRQTGKWIVAQAEEESALNDLLANALASGASGLEFKSKSDLQSALPQVAGECAIYSSQTGIVDPFEFSKSLLDDALRNGAELLIATEVLKINVLDGCYELITSRGPITTELVFNCAGLFADDVARLAGIEKYEIFPWRGDYFRIQRKLALETLVYPVKKKGAAGLGIHLTVALDGTCRLGPDVELASSKLDFSSRENKRDLFWQSAVRYLPDLRPEDLVYDTCGLRPKLRGPNDSDERDFIVAEDLPGFVNFIGIESPGLTAAMALAEQAATSFLPGQRREDF